MDHPRHGNAGSNFNAKCPPAGTLEVDPAVNATVVKLNLKTLTGKVTLLLLVPVAFEVGFIVALGWLWHQSEMEAQANAHYKTVALETNRLLQLFYQAGLTLMDYHTSESPVAIARYEEAIKKVPEHFNYLRAKVAINDYERLCLERMAPHVNEGVKLLQETKTVMQNGIDLNEFRKTPRRTKQLRQTIIHLMGEIENTLAYLRKTGAGQTESTLEHTKELIKDTLWLWLLLNMALLIWLPRLVERSVRRIDVLIENTNRIKKAEPLAEPLGGSDEIADLDAVFHDMARALTDAARKERAIIDNALDVICSIDPLGIFTKVSPASQAAWGYAPDELVGRHCGEVLSCEDVPETMAMITTIVEGHWQLPFESRVEHKDGRIINVLWSAHWVDREKSLFCVAHDITDRKIAEDRLKASEARIRLIIERMLVGLIIVRENGEIDSINPRTEDLFQYDQKDLIGKHINVLFDQSQRGQDDPFHSILQRGQGRVMELQARKAHGDSFPVELTLTEFETDEGKRHLLNLLDVSERHEVERLKREFVAMVSHDLRTPLTSVLSSLSLLSAGMLGQLNSRGEKIVSDAENELTRLIHLINDLLDIARMEAGRMEINFQPTGLQSVVDQSVSAVNRLAQHKGIDIKATDVDYTVQGDKNRLIQVVVNLLSNAIKFSPQNSQISICAERCGDTIETRVSDQGPGIAEADRDSIFNRFEQLEGGKEKGFGLGLAICKTIMEAHGGSIGVNSQAGEGSTFWFRLSASPTTIAIDSLEPSSEAATKASA